VLLVLVLARSKKKTFDGFLGTSPSSSSYSSWLPQIFFFLLSSTTNENNYSQSVYNQSLTVFSGKDMGYYVHHHRSSTKVVNREL